MPQSRVQRAQYTLGKMGVERAALSALPTRIQGSANPTNGLRGPSKGQSSPRIVSCFLVLGSQLYPGRVLGYCIKLLVGSLE